MAGTSLAASLPSDLLRLIFASVGPPSHYRKLPLTTVLSFEERVRAEVGSA